MTKGIIAAVLLLATATTTMASRNDDRAVQFGQLPKQAQTTITKYFGENKISYAKQDTDMFDGDYEVMFTDGKKIEFKKNGEWKDIECKRSEVPAGLIPQSIKSYVSQNHPTQKIVEIDRDTRDYEMKLSDGTELKFNLKGHFLRYDY